MRIAICGGGIGGLTAALVLRSRGFDVTVFEQAPQIRGLGVGINVLPHAVGVLSRLGLEPALKASAIETKEYVFTNRYGQAIFADQRGLAAGYEHAQYSIHRGELQMILLEAAQRALPEGALRTGHRLAGFRDAGQAVELSFENGERATADLLIGADGIHSAVRGQLFPGEGAPRWNGITMWRGVTEGAPFLSGRSVVLAGYHEQKFVCYPISARHAAKGRALINWIADLKQDRSEMLPREDWNRPGRLEDFLPRFAGWRFPFLDVAETIRTASAVFEFPMVDRDPLPGWTAGRVTLLGDAAHPTTPLGSNGATQAMLDAEALGDALAAEPHPAGLQAYEAKRRPAAEAVVQANRSRGFDIILDIVHERAPHGFQRLEDVVPPAEIAEIVANYKRVTGHRQSAPTSSSSS